MADTGSGLRGPRRGYEGPAVAKIRVVRESLEVQGRPDAMDLRILQLIREDKSTVTDMFKGLEKEYPWLHLSMVRHKLDRLQEYEYATQLNEHWSLASKGEELVSSGAQILVTKSFERLPTVPFDLIVTSPVEVQLRNSEGNQVESYTLGFGSQTFGSLMPGFARYINTNGSPVWIKPHYFLKVPSC